jgi:hypothetical protein
MAMQENIQTFTYESDQAIPQYVAVIPSTTIARGCHIAGAAATKVLGVSLFAVAAANRAVTVARDGIVKIKAGAAVSIGAIITTDSTGRAVTGASGFGTAITAAGAADEIIEVQWGPVPQ